MQKAYSKRNWKNRPNTSTPLGESNLTPMDNAIDEIDNRVVAYDTTKANQSDLLTAFKAVSFNSSTGVFTFTKFNDTTVTVDTDIEKIAVNFDYDDDPTSAHYQNLIITLEDGTVKYVDMSALITEYEFSDSSTIHFSVTSGVVSANVINGSITADHLAPSVMAGINSAVASAENSAKDSEAWAVGQRSGTDVPSTDETYHNNSKYYSGLSKDSAEDSEAYAIGKRGGTDVPSTDPTYHNNAKYYAEQAEQAVASVAISAFGTTSWGGLSNDIFFATMTDADYVPSNGDLIALNFNTNFEAYTSYLQIRIHNVNYHVKVNGVEIRNAVPVLTYVLAGYSGIFYFDGTYLNLVNVSGGIKKIGYSGTRVSARNTLEFTGDVTVTDGGPFDDKLTVNIKGGGHSLVNSSGTTMAQEDAMQFADAFLTDDSVNGKTVVENIKEHTTASDYEQATEDGIHVIDDGDDAVIGAVSDDTEVVTADGTKTIGTLFNELFTKIDSSKLTKDSKLVIEFANGDMIFNIGYDGAAYEFIAGQYDTVWLGRINNTSSILNQFSIVDATKYDQSSYVLPKNKKIILYYGNKKAIVDLQTTANRCWYDEETTVKQKLDEKTSIGVINITDIYLNDLTWSQDSAGKYYALIQRVTSIGSGILISAIITEFEKLKASDVIQLYWLPGTSDIKVMSNVNSFTTNARISIRLAYIEE